MTHANSYQLIATDVFVTKAFHPLEFLHPGDFSLVSTSVMNLIDSKYPIPSPTTSHRPRPLAWTMKCEAGKAPIHHRYVLELFEFCFIFLLACFSWNLYVQ